MAEVSGAGRAGVNAERLFFSQPRGQVTTTSSKAWVSPAEVVMEIWSLDVSILTTFWLSLMVASDCGALATYSRIRL